MKTKKTMIEMHITFIQESKVGKLVEFCISENLFKPRSNNPPWWQRLPYLH